MNYNNEGNDFPYGENFGNNQFQSIDNDGKNKGSKMYLLIILLILLGFGAYLYLNKNNDNGPLIDINLSSTSITIKEKEKGVVYYSVLNTTNFVPVMFTSSDPSIVTVDNDGNITGVSSGTAFVTLTFNNGKENVVKRCDIIVEEEKKIEDNSTPEPTPVDTNVPIITSSPSNNIDSLVDKYRQRLKDSGAFTDEQINSMVNNYRDKLQNGGTGGTKVK